MPTIKNRQMQIPGGYKFFLAATKWSPRPWASFREVCETLLSHLQGNPAVAQQLGWSLTMDTMEKVVDAYNANMCKALGYTDYYVETDGGSTAPPFPQPSVSLSSKLRNVAAGSEVLVEWIASGAEAVARELAEHRASICVSCPKNGQGGFEAFFTVPVSNAIRRAMVDKDGMHLSTTQDSKLGICTACQCPLPLKIWVPIDKIAKRIPEESKAALWENCWMRKEGIT